MKKFMSILLSLVMVLGMLPTVALAAGEDPWSSLVTGSSGYTFTAGSDGAADTIVLTNDVTLSGTWTIAADSSYELDLAGHTLTGPSSSSGVNYVISNGGTLTVKNSNSNGQIVSGGTDSTATNNRGILNSGTLTISGGTVGGGIAIMSTGTLNVTGGTIGGDSTTYGIVTSGGTANISGESTTVTGTYAVQAQSGATLTISGGTISGTRGISTSGENTITVSGGTISGNATSGIGAFLTTNSTLTVTGGEISGLYGILAKGGNTITISNGTISGGSENGGGPGVYLQTASSTLKVEGGTISGLWGVYDEVGSQITISNGEISGNDTSSGAAGVSLVAGSSTLGVTGGTISGYLGVNTTGESTITISGGTVSGKYGVTNNGSGTVTISSDATISGTTRAVENGISGTMNITGGTFSTTGESSDVVAANYGGVMSVTGGTFTQNTEDKDVFGAYGTADGGTISETDNPVNASNSLTITGVTIENTDGGGVSCWNSGNVTIGSGTKITAGGNAINGNNLNPNQNITIEDGAEITSNEGAAIYKTAAGTLTINGGTLTGKAGVVVRAGTVTISGDTNITANGTESLNVGDSGNAVSPAAVVLDTDNSYSTEAVTVEISGGTFTAGTNQPAVTHSKKSDGDLGTLSITGGTFSSDPSSYVAEGYEAVANDDESTWTVQAASADATLTFTTIAEGTELLAYGTDGGKMNPEDLGTFTVTQDETDEKVIKVTGTANYITDWTAFNGTVEEEQNGHYLPIKITGAENTTITVKNVSSGSGTDGKTHTIGSDGTLDMVIWLDGDRSEREDLSPSKILVTVGETTYTIDFSELMLLPKAAEGVTVEAATDEETGEVTGVVATATDDENTVASVTVPAEVEDLGSMEIQVAATSEPPTYATGENAPTTEVQNLINSGDKVEVKIVKTDAEGNTVEQFTSDGDTELPKGTKISVTIDGLTGGSTYHIFGVSSGKVSYYGYKTLGATDTSLTFKTSHLTVFSAVEETEENKAGLTAAAASVTQETGTDLTAVPAVAAFGYYDNKNEANTACVAALKTIGVTTIGDTAVDSYEWDTIDKTVVTLMTGLTDGQSYYYEWLLGDNVINYDTVTPSGKTWSLLRFSFLHQVTLDKLQSGTYTVNVYEGTETDHGNTPVATKSFDLTLTTTPAFNPTEVTMEKDKTSVVLTLTDNGAGTYTVYTKDETTGQYGVASGVTAALDGTDQKKLTLSFDSAPTEDAELYITANDGTNLESAISEKVTVKAYVAETTTYSISGTVSAGETEVTDVSNITVTLYAESDTERETPLGTGTTDENGAYTINDSNGNTVKVAAGSYIIVVEAATGSYAAASAKVTVSDSNVTNADITLKSAVTTISEVAVTLNTENLTTDSELPEAATATEGVKVSTKWYKEDGTEVTSFETAGTYTAKITVTANEGYELTDGVTYTLNGTAATLTEGVLTAEATVSATAQPTALSEDNVSLSATTGTLTDGSATLPTVTVDVDGATEKTNYTVTWTDSEGTEVEGTTVSAAGTYTATVAAVNGDTVVSGSVTLTFTVTDKTEPKTYAATIVVSTEDEDGNTVAVSGATVTVTDSTNSEATPVTATEDSTTKGTYNVELPAGTYTVKVEATGYNAETGTLTVAENGENTVSIALTAEEQVVILTLTKNEADGSYTADLSGISYTGGTFWLATQTARKVSDTDDTILYNINWVEISATTKTVNVGEGYGDGVSIFILTKAPTRNSDNSVHSESGTLLAYGTSLTSDSGN